MLVIYRTPEDTDAFLRHYKDVHMPLVRKLPGLISADATLINRSLVGEHGIFLVATLAFADATCLKTALKSAENAAVGADAMAFAGPIISVMTGSSLVI